MNTPFRDKIPIKLSSGNRCHHAKNENREPFHGVQKYTEKDGRKRKTATEVAASRLKKVD
jgi:hypothetical protein